MTGPTLMNEVLPQVMQKTTDILTDGDVQSNPGPTPTIQKYRKKIKAAGKLHIRIILLAATLIIKTLLNWDEKYTAQEESNICQSISTIKSSVISAEILALKKNRKVLKLSLKNPGYLCLLLLLSGDIKPNPGPTNHIQKCPTCKVSLNDNNRLVCNDCKACYHKGCSLPQNMTTRSGPRNKSYQWICLNPLCKPNTNFYSSGDQNNTTKSNRYTILEDNDHRRKSSSCRSKKPPKRINKKELYKAKNAYSLWSELTNISPKDYQGNELCKGCNNKITKVQRSISCDSCNRWIHQRCSDMKEKVYKANMKRKNFPWTCNICRIDDCIINDKPDLKLLKPNEMPETLESIKLYNTPKDMLILHMNCASMVNKREEIEHICNELKPDIICFTETWLDESVQTQSCTPTGYKMIRKDRSEEYKQKYGKSKGGGVAVCYKEHLKVEKKHYLTED